jgi:hypothetical protein
MSFIPLISPLRIGLDVLEFAPIFVVPLCVDGQLGS